MTDFDYATDAEIAHEQGWDYPDPATEMAYAAREEEALDASPSEDSDEDFAAAIEAWATRLSDEQPC